MNLTFNVDLPDRDKEMVEQIEDLEARIAWFVGEQVALERWRRDRQQPEDRDVALEAIRQARVMKQSGTTREEVAEQFLKRWDELMTQVSP